MEYCQSMIKRLYIGIAFFLFFISLFLGIDRFVHKRSSHFAFDKITPVCKDSCPWDTPPLSLEEQKAIDQILSQKFTYYNKGSQSYVFISEDKKYILKFLKQQKLETHTWLAYIPFSFNPYYQERLFKEKKYVTTFNALKTAYTELKKESGLIYVHLQDSNTLSKKVTFFDRNGTRHVFDIGKKAFYLQKRAQLIYSRIAELMHDGDVESAKNIITSVFSLIDFLGKKGVVDNDPILRKNFGLIDDIAVQIDVGKLRIDPSRPDYKAEVASITNSFRVWLESNYPALTDHFQQCLNHSREPVAKL